MTPTTKLEAVNIILSSIGESPVNSLNSGLVDAEMAETILESISRDVQSQGWHFNTEIKMKVVPNNSNEIVLPNDCLRVDLHGYSQSDYIQRGKKIYDKTNHTFTISETLEVDMVVLLPFEDTPEALRRYVTVKAARVFQDRAVGSVELHGFQEKDEMLALVELKDAEANTGDYSIFDNYDVYRIIDRNITTTL